MNSSLASSPSLSEQETPTAVPRPPQITPFYPQPILPIGWVNYEYFITRYQTALTPEEQSRSSFQLFEITNGTHEPDLKEFWLKTAMSHRSTEMFALAAEDIIGYRLGYGTPRNKGSKQVLETLEEMGYDTSMEGGFDLAWQAVKKGSPRSSQQISYHLMKPDASTCFALQKTMDKHGITFTDSLPYRLTAIALYGGNGHAAHTYAEHSNSHRLLQENPGKFPPSPDTEQYAEWIGHLGYNINDSKLAWRLRVIAVFGKNPKSAEKCKKNPARLQQQQERIFDGCF